MRKILGFTVAVFLLLLSSPSAAQLDRSADPLWRALQLAPRSPAGAQAPRPAALFKEDLTKSNCSASANCGGGSPISCSSSTSPSSCTAVDQNCYPGQLGYVDCGSGRTFCPNYDCSYVAVSCWD